jgi:hypothetical protein
VFFLVTYLPTKLVVCVYIYIYIYIYIFVFCLCIVGSICLLIMLMYIDSFSC